jgi:hypothetical protein
MSQMFQKVHIPLYEGCPNSHFATILLIFNLIIIHSVSNTCTFVDKLFALLGNDLFLKGNTLPKSMYHAKRLIQWLVLGYKSIHTCYNGCVLFKKDLRDATSYLKCKKSRFINGSDCIPCKVL